MVRPIVIESTVRIWIAGCRQMDHTRPHWDDWFSSERCWRRGSAVPSGATLFGLSGVGANDLWFVQGLPAVRKASGAYHLHR